MATGKKMAPAVGIKVPEDLGTESLSELLSPIAGPAPAKPAPEEPMTTKKKNRPAAKEPKRRATGKGEVALVTRISKEAMTYLKEKAGDEPVTRLLRKILAAGDARLGKLLGVE